MKLGSFIRRALVGLGTAGVCLVTFAAGGSAATAVDTEPPVIVALPLDPVSAPGNPTVRVRILDQSGVGQAILWVRGVEDAEFRSIPMEHSTGDEFVASVEAWPTRGDDFLYYVQAEDASGNGPTFSGNPRSPFIARIEYVDAAGVEETLVSARSLGLLIAGGLLLICWAAQKLTVHERRRQVIVALNRLNPHPEHPEPDSASEVAPSEEPAVHEFWHALLAPLTSMDLAERRQALANLASRAHHHPLQGKRFFDQATLARRLRALSIAEAGQPPPGSPTSPQSGMTMVELLVVLLLIALGTGLAAVSMKPMEKPVRSAGEIVDGMLQHARTRAMATTTPHRLRAISPTSLIVESGPSCSAGPWMLEPKLQAELPEQVELATSGWSVCFVSRGASTTSRTITLEHPDLASQQIQVLIGGAVKWL